MRKLPARAGKPLRSWSHFLLLQIVGKRSAVSEISELACLELRGIWRG